MAIEQRRQPIARVTAGARVMSLNDRYEIARQVRDECIKTALSAYENASISGLCAEGAFEAAISAVRMLDVEALVDVPLEGKVDDA